MAEVVLRAADVPTLPMPALCARTGRPAHQAIRVKIAHTPSWAWLGGVLVIVLLALVPGPRCDIDVPYAKGRNARRGLGAAGIVVGLILTMASAMTLILETSVFSVLFFGVSAALLGGSAWLYHDSVGGGRWVDEHHVKLTRLHPAFAAALQQIVDYRYEMERRLALAGWHADPGGTHAYRYFDGAAWTEHVA